MLTARTVIGGGGGNWGTSPSRSLALNPLAVLPPLSSHTFSYSTFLRAPIRSLPRGCGAQHDKSRMPVDRWKGAGLGCS